jgi:phosphoesterase RecJ-like protein
MLTLNPFMLDHASVRTAMTLFSKAKTIKCICHRNPDGDAIGALLGIAGMLRAQYPSAVVTTYCVDPAPETFHYLDGAQAIRSDLKAEEGDMFIVVDAAEPKLTEYHEKFPKIFDGSLPCVWFDHHPGKTVPVTVPFVVPTASSTCELLVAFAEIAAIALTSDVATALLTGVYTDTGGLLHSNTTPQVYRTVARLIRAGARQQAIVTNVFRTAKISTLKLWGRVLENISLTGEGGAVAALRESDFKATGADYSELTGAIDYVNAVPGMRFSLILSERDGKVKGSLRTLRDDIDVAAMAQKFDGGGHKKAAGFAVAGSLSSEVRWKVVPSEGKPQSQNDG